jgi:hypothetical protein
MNILELQEKLETFGIIIDRLEYIVEQEPSNTDIINILNNAKELTVITDINNELIQSVLEFLTKNENYIWDEYRRISE